MAKNNNKQKKAVEVSQEKTMTEKVTSANNFQEDSLLARVIGLGLVALGVVFVILAIVIVYLSRQEPELDRSVQTPSLEIEETFINGKSVEISGKSEKGENVAIYLNGERLDETASVDNNGNYRYTLDIQEEGKNEIETATIVGFPQKRVSERSEKLVVEADYTAPSNNAELNYDPTSNNGDFTLSGKIDPNTKIIIESEDDRYEAISDANGDFSLIANLQAESTTFNVTLEDEAGNTRELARKIDVNYPTFADANGDIGPDGATTSAGVAGVSTGTTAGELPEAAGELDAALDILFGNNLMLAFGLIALIVFIANSSIVALKLKQQRA